MPIQSTNPATEEMLNTYQAATPEEVEAALAEATGAFRTLLLESRQVEGLIADKRIAAVTLTGGDTAGSGDRRRRVRAAVRRRRERAACGRSL